MYKTNLVKLCGADVIHVYDPSQELCEAAVSSLGSPISSRLLFCPLCTQSFGYSYGLECHLLSVHHEELLTNRPHREAIQ